MLLAACVVAGLVGASVLPVARLPADPGNYLGHLSAYGAAMVALSGGGPAEAWITALGLVALGICIEFLQPWSPARTTGRTWPPTRSVSVSVG